MNNAKQVLVTGLLLMVFAVIGSSMVGITYESTVDQIAENERLAMLRSLNQILPHGSYDNDLLDDTLVLDADDRLGQKQPSTAYLAKNNGTITAIIFSPIAPDGYSGEIKLLVGIKVDGTVAGVRVVSHKETPGLGDYVETSRSDWILGFAGKSLQSPDEQGWKVKRDGGQFDQFTGATITPRAVVKAVHNSLVYFNIHKKSLLGTTNNE